MTEIEEFGKKAKSRRMGLPGHCRCTFPQNCEGCPEFSYCLGYAHGSKDIAEQLQAELAELEEE